MRKRKFSPVNWNQLTVKDINGIIRHFAKCEKDYREMSKTEPLWVPSITVCQERQVFWKSMIPVVRSGQKLSHYVGKKAKKMS